MKKALILLFSVFQILLLHTDTIHGGSAVESADYVEEVKYECHYINGTQEVKYLVREFYNQEETMYFDSDSGYYIAKTELGRIGAEQYNKDKEYIEYLKAAVQTFCVHNYGVLHGVTADRRVTPKIKVSLMPHDEDSHAEHHILGCNVYGFFPSEIEIKWYRNGQEKTEQVQSTELFHNGDWTFHVIVTLETEIKRGDNFSCEVHHSSLEAPSRVDWRPQMSDSASNKVVTGVVGFVLGTILIIAGAVVYIRGRKAQMTFRGPQTEHFIHS